MGCAYKCQFSSPPTSCACKKVVTRRLSPIFHCNCALHCHVCGAKHAARLRLPVKRLRQGSQVIISPACIRCTCHPHSTGNPCTTLLNELCRAEACFFFFRTLQMNPVCQTATWPCSPDTPMRVISEDLLICTILHRSGEDIEDVCLRGAQEGQLLSIWRYLPPVKAQADKSLVYIRGLKYV